MENGRLITGAVVGLLAAAIGIWSWRDSNEVLGLVAIALGAAAIALAASKWRRAGACAGLGAFLILLAVYLPALGAEVTVEDWFGETDAGAADQADAVAFARWCLLVAGVLLIAWPGRRLLLETSLTVVVLLAIVAATAATITLADRLTTTDAKDPTQADVRRGFALPADRIEPVTTDLAADACAKVVLVRATDENTADQENALTYTNSTYTVRLPATVEAGKPGAGITVELSEDPAGTKTAETFATDLTAAKSVYLLGC